MLQTVKDTLDDLGYGKTKEQKAKDADNTKAMKAQYTKEYGGFGEMRYAADLDAWNREQKSLKELQKLKESGDTEAYNTELAKIADEKKRMENLRAAGMAQPDKGPSIVENFMNGVTKHAKGGSIRSGATGLVGEAGPELVSGPASVISAATTEQLITAIDALREMNGTRLGNNDFNWQVGMSEGRRKVLENRIGAFKGVSLDALEKAFASTADYKPISDARDAMGFAKGGIASGSLGGFQAELHGTEAVVPLPDNKSIPVKLDSSALTASLYEQNGLLTSILAAMNKGNSLSSGILQNSY